MRQGHYNGITRISFIIPCKNEEKNIHRLLTSIFADEKTSPSVPYEIIIVNDNSCDSTESYIRRLRSDKMLFFSLVGESGTGAARNLGLTKATGKYVYFLDSDDEFVGFEVIKILIDLAERHEAVICGGNMEIRDSGVVRDASLIASEYLFINEGFISYSDYQYDYGFTRFIYDRDFLISNNLFFPRRTKYEDPLFMQNAFFCAGFFYAVPIVSYIINAHFRSDWNNEEKNELLVGMSESLAFFKEKKYVKGFFYTVNRMLKDFKEIIGDSFERYYGYIDDIVRSITLWEIVFPELDIAEEKELFCRTHVGGYIKEQDHVLYCPFSRISYDTYFNSFSIKKWKEYTRVNSFGLLIDAEGSYTIRVYSYRLQGGRLDTDIVCTHNVVCDTRKYTYIDIEDQAGRDIISFTIETREKPVKLYKAVYIDPAMNDTDQVNYAAVMTTYKQENRLISNIRRKETGFTNFHLYVADNADVLDCNPDDDVTIIKSTDAGRSGGSAVGLMRVADEKKFRGFTHCIIMNDDIVLDTHVLNRLNAFLSRVRGEYRDNPIAGAALSVDIPYIQIEASAKWNGGKPISYGAGFDLRNIEKMIENEKNNEADHGKWWFCIFPINAVRMDNLPLPLYAHYYDVDYGIRWEIQPITVNGISVWCDYSENKTSASELYYHIRNTMIVNSMNGVEKLSSFIKYLYSNTLLQVYGL